MLPLAIECEITYERFFHMTMKAVRIHIEAYEKRRKEAWKFAEYQAWLSGFYNMYAIGVNFSKKIKYPQNPLKEEYVVREDMELTEEEKEKWRKDLFSRLRGMAKNHKSQNKEKIKQKA